MTKLLSNTWVAAALGTVVYLLAIVLFWQKPVLPAQNTFSDIVASVGPSWSFSNPEADQLMVELRAEKRIVKEREEQLDALRAELNKQHENLLVDRDAVSKMQSEFDKAVLRVKDEETLNLKKLAKVYTAMTPDSAANVLGQLDNEAVVKVMLFLKEADVAGILESMAKKSDADARRAAQISEQIRLSAHSTTAK